MGVGGERLLLGHRLGADDDPVDDVRVPSRAVRAHSAIYAIAVFAFSRLRYTRAGSGTETELDLDRSPRTSMTPATAASTASDGSAAARNRV